MLEQCCKKLAESRKIEWFQAREAKIFCKLYCYEKLSLADLSLLTAINPEELKELLKEMGKRKITAFDGAKYFIPKPLEALNKLVAKAELESIIAIAK